MGNVIYCTSHNYKSPFQITIHSYEKWKNMISYVNLYFFNRNLTPHSQIVRMANHFGEFLKVNRLQPGKMLQILSGNDIKHATSNFFFVEFFYMTQKLPRNPSFFSNCNLFTKSQFEIKQHVAIVEAHYFVKDAHLQIIWQFSAKT